MATTYEKIATNTLGSSAASVNFTSISGTYTDLVIVAVPKLVSGTAQVLIQLNGDTGANYNLIRMYGDGTGFASDVFSGLSFGQLSWGGYTGSTFGQVITASINSYSNTTTFKTIISRPNNANYGVGENCITWRNTAAVTSILIYSDAANFATGSTFTLYGIKAA